MIKASVMALAAFALTAAAREVKVSGFGFDPDDSTRFLQQALDSGARRIVVDRRESPWMTRPLSVRSDTEIVFEEGAEIQAKKGAFTNRFATLFTLKGVSGVRFTGRGKGGTVRMHKGDYQNPPYAVSEYRHAFNLLGVKNVVIENLDILESGGDGVYVGAFHAGGRWHDCENLTVRGCRIDGHNRQAISVISAKGLYVDDCKLVNTGGMAPMAGVDFEPNDRGQRLVDCVFRRCEIAGNEHTGVFFATGNLKSSTVSPVSIRFEDCLIHGNKVANVRVAPSFSTGSGDAVSGLAEFVRCTIDCSKGERGLVFDKKISACYRVVFTDCTLIEPSGDWKGRTAVELGAGAPGEPFADGFTFKRFTVKQPYLRAWCSLERENYSKIRPVDWRGDVTCKAPDGTRTDKLDAAWCKKTFPPPPDETLPRPAGDFASAETIDPYPGRMLPLSPFAVRMDGRFAFYAAKAGPVSFRYRYNRMPDYPNENPRLRLSLKDAAGGTLETFAPIGFSPEARTLRLEVPAAGFYLLDSAATHYAALTFLASEVPFAIDVSERRLEAVYSEGSLRFHVPSGSRVGFFLSNDPGERVDVKVSDFSGRVRWDLAGFCSELSREQTCSPEETSGFWRIDFSKSRGSRLRKYVFHLIGVPGYLFPDAERAWLFR